MDEAVKQVKCVFLVVWICCLQREQTLAQADLYLSQPHYSGKTPWDTLESPRPAE